MDFDNIPRETDSVMFELVEAERSGDAAAIQRAYEHVFLLCYLNGLDLTEMLSHIEQGDFWPLQSRRAELRWSSYN